MPSFVAAEAVPLREPIPLGPGARVALIAPSGPLRGPEDAERAAANARRLGLDPVLGAHVLERAGYFAGRDEARAADLQWALDDPSIDGIWCIRGGYGAARLLPAVSITHVAERAKPLIGYSDITALHALWSRAGLVSYHGPTGRAEIPDDTFASLAAAVVQQADSAGAIRDGIVLRGGTARGRLAGGNLALVASLCGTPWEIDFTGTIAVFEDVNEATYRIDRMLNQLRQGSSLRACAAIVFGQFTACTPEADEGARSLDDVLGECAELVGVPTVMNAPFGHVDQQWTLPLGAVASLDADPGPPDIPRLTIHRSPHTSSARNAP